MPKSPKFINTSGEEEEKLGTCTNNHARAVPQRTFHQERRQEHVSTLSLFPTNRQQDDGNHSCVNQSKTIIKPPMPIQLKVNQNEKKNTLKLNSLTSFIHPMKKRKEKKKHNQMSLTQTYHVLSRISASS